MKPKVAQNSWLLLSFSGQQEHPSVEVFEDRGLKGSSKCNLQKSTDSYHKVVSKVEI